MADLSGKDASQSVIISGANPSTGVETNYLDVDSSGRPTVKIQDSSGNTIVNGQKPMANSVPVVFASDQTPLAVTTQGSRADVSSNKLYSIAADVNMATSGADNPIILLRNPIGSGKTLFIETITAGCAISNKINLIKLFFNPTITTNGTTVTTVSRNVGGGAPAAVALVGSLPTVSATGSYAENLVIGQATNSEILSTDYTIAVQPGNSILVTGRPDANNVIMSIHIVWLEE